MKASTAVGFGWLLLIVVVAIFIINAGPCDGLYTIGKTIGEKQAARQMAERDERERQNQIEMQRLLKEREAAEKAKESK